METNEEASMKNIWRTKLKTENEEIFWNDGLRRITKKRIHEMLRMGMKRIPHNRNNNEDGMKLEPRIFKRTGQDLRETLLRSSNVENEDEKCHEELLSTPEWRIKKVEPTMKRIWKRSWRRHVTDGNHSYVTLWKEFEYNSRKIEESGKILGKDLWVRAHSKEITVGKDCLRDIAPVELNGLNKMTISK